jgi:hypothetical protein
MAAVVGAKPELQGTVIGLAPTVDASVAPEVQAMLVQMAAVAADPAAKALREVFIGNMPDGMTDQVRRTPCRPRSWANFSVL